MKARKVKKPELPSPEDYLSGKVKLCKKCKAPEPWMYDLCIECYEELEPEDEPYKVASNCDWCTMRHGKYAKGHVRGVRKLGCTEYSCDTCEFVSVDVDVWED